MKGLEALKDIREIFTCHDFDFIEKCDIIEKALEALEIIRDKKVFVANLIYHFENDDNVINYNRSCGWAKSELTQEEYELLKEVLYGKETS